MKLSVDVPEEALVIVAARVPEMLSQRNCDHVGMTPDDFLRAVADAEAEGVPIIRQRRLRLVDRVTFIAWLRARATRRTAAAANDEADVEREVAAGLDKLTGCAPVRRSGQRR